MFKPIVAVRDRSALKPTISFRDILDIKHIATIQQRIKHHGTKPNSER